MKFHNPPVKNVLNVVRKWSWVQRNIGSWTVPSFEVIQVQRMPTGRKTMWLCGETPRFANVENVAGFIEDRDITGASFNNGLEKFLSTVNLIKDLYGQPGR
jgi:hypothetical protein